MGDYLIVDGIENNSKCISYPMARLIVAVLPEKDVYSGERSFLLKQKEVADILYIVNELICNDDLLQAYIDKHKGEYYMNSRFEEVKDVFTTIQQTFAKVLSRMVYFDIDVIVCLWE